MKFPYTEPNLSNIICQTTILNIHTVDIFTMYLAANVVFRFFKYVFQQLYLLNSVSAKYSHTNILKNHCSSEDCVLRIYVVQMSYFIEEKHHY